MIRVICITVFKMDADKVGLRPIISRPYYRSRYWYSVASVSLSVVFLWHYVLWL